MPFPRIFRVKPLYFILIQSLFQRLALCVCYEIRIELSGHTNYIKTQGEYLCVVILLNQWKANLLNKFAPPPGSHWLPKNHLSQKSAKISKNYNEAHELFFLAFLVLGSQQCIKYLLSQSCCNMPQWKCYDLKTNLLYVFFYSVLHIGSKGF